MAKGIKVAEIPDAGILGLDREFRLGTRFVTELGKIYKYGKIDFGVLSHEDGKAMRDVRYGWLRVRL